MFNKLTEFGYKRDFKEAIGFYLAYLFLFLILAFLMGGIIALTLEQEVNILENILMRMGVLGAVIGSLVLSFLVLKDKNLLGNLKYIIVGISSGILALFGGALLALLPVAFLTTRVKKMEDNTRKEQQSESDENSKKKDRTRSEDETKDKTSGE